MMSRGARTGGLRAVTGVIALYAFVLQAFLGGLLPLPSSTAQGEICLGQLDSGSPTDGKPVDSGHARHQACCIAACVAIGMPQPIPSVTGIAWPPRDAARVTWRSETRVAARGPPGSIAHPRGPPTV